MVIVLFLYLSLIISLIYYSYIKTLVVRNRHNLVFISLSIESLLILELIFSSEVTGIFVLVISNYFFLFLFIVYIFTIVYRTWLAYKLSKITELNIEWWSAYWEMAEVYVKKAYINSIVTDLKIYKKEAMQYALKKLYSNKLQRRFKIYINFISYFYIFLYIFVFISFIILNIIVWGVDLPALYLIIYNWFIVKIHYFIILIFLYRLFLSYIFSNIMIRYFYRLTSVIVGDIEWVVDTYRISDIFMMRKHMVAKQYLFESDLVRKSAVVFGQKKYMPLVWGKDSELLFVTFKKKIVFLRYYLPHSWSSYKNIELDELVNTPIYRFRKWIFKWKHIIFFRHLKRYIHIPRRNLGDRYYIEFSRYYEKDLKRNYVRND